MGVNLENFNRIIDLQFIQENAGYDSRGNVVNKWKSIITPRHGIKPQIEINGTLHPTRTLSAFNITIKNLYMDLRTEEYSKIRVRAGYANNWIQFEAEIFSMYQDSPGPDGTWVIQCVLGQVMETWLNTTVSVKYNNGTMLTEILNNLNKKLGGTGVTTGAKAKGLSLKAPLQFDGSVRDLLTNLEARFADRHLRTFMRGSTICAICITEGDFINTRVLEYMSAPPQQNPGDEDGNWTTMITAPWMPDLSPGDQLSIPSNIYRYSGSLVGGANKTQLMEVTEINFHFGTRGSINQMTCRGFIVR